jgi:hypothetical protein
MPGVDEQGVGRAGGASSINDAELAGKRFPGEEIKWKAIENYV